jgi:hypothetical protein
MSWYKIKRTTTTIVFYIGVMVAFLSMSCGAFGDNIIISNNSDYPVTFKFLSGNSNTHILNSNETEKYYASSSTLSFYKSDPPRVTYKMASDSDGEFINTLPIALEIRNTLDFPITLSEKSNYMDMQTIRVDANETKFSENIYSKNPDFIVSPLAKVNFIVSEKNIMYVTIY